MKIEKIFIKNNLMFGRMIALSKSVYMRKYPKHLVVFNANILTKEDGKIWYGDIDINTDKEVLNKIAKEIDKKIYILKEMDCRFETENENVDMLISKAVWESE